MLLAFSLVEVVLQISPVFMAIIVVLTLPTLYSFFIELLLFLTLYIVFSLSVRFAYSVFNDHFLRRASHLLPSPP